MRDDAGLDDTGLDTVERRLESVIVRYVPYLGLAIGTALTPFVIPATVQYWLVTGGLVVLAAAWSYGFTARRPARADEPRAGALYVTGLLVLMGALVYQSPSYGFQAFAGYVHSFRYLHGRWRVAGVVVTAAFAAYSQVGARLTDLDLTAVPGMLLLTAVNAALGGGVTFLGALGTWQAERRRQMINELEQTNQRLSETLQENAGLHVQLLVQAREAGVLDERARMAREIHDTLAQGLTGIVAQLEAADAADAQPERRRRHVDTARVLARDSLIEARRSVQALAPGPLQDARLPDAVADLATRWADSTGVALTVQTTGDPRPLSIDLEVTLFRVAQEALANVARHAAASKVGVTLSYMDDVVVLDVRDDGVGFATARTGPDPGPSGPDRGPDRRPGFGLSAMRQRVARVAGRLDVESSPGAGTAVSASVPLIGPERAA